MIQHDTVDQYVTMILKPWLEHWKVELQLPEMQKAVLLQVVFKAHQTPGVQDTILASGFCIILSFIQRKLLRYNKTQNLTFSRKWGGHFVRPHLNHSISSKRLGVWSYCYVTFLSMYFPFRKVQFHHLAFVYVAMATMQLLPYFPKLESPLFFKYFHLRETFCGITYASDMVLL